MRKDIKEILEKLSIGEKPFFEQDSLPVSYQKMCADRLIEYEDDEYILNEFFDKIIAPIIFYSHEMYLAHR
jgi:hypothetical protein